MSPAGYSAMAIALALLVAVAWTVLSTAAAVWAGDVARTLGGSRAQARAMVIVTWLCLALLGAYGLQAVLP